MHFTFGAGYCFARSPRPRGRLACGERPRGRGLGAAPCPQFEMHRRSIGRCTRSRIMQKPAQIRLFVVLACGIFAVSTASILIRSALDDGVPPLVIAAYRLTLAALILTPIVLRARRPNCAP